MVLLSVKSVQGERDYMEDRYSYYEKGDCTITILCDGHGGHKTAEVTVKILPEIIYNVIKNVRLPPYKMAKLLRAIIIKWGEKIMTRKAGSTFISVVTKGAYVYVINIGDSRATFAMKESSPVFMLKSNFGTNGQFIDNLNVKYKTGNFFKTIDHDPETAEEIARIRNAGGFIRDGRLNGILSLTRALGDAEIGNGLSFVPDVYWVKKSNIIGPILLYTDGVYEPQRYNSSVSFTDKQIYILACKFGTAAVVSTALKYKSSDNITAMMIAVT